MEMKSTNNLQLAFQLACLTVLNQETIKVSGKRLGTVTIIVAVAKTFQSHPLHPIGQMLLPMI